jgi:hypothetical protein
LEVGEPDYSIAVQVGGIQEAGVARLLTEGSEEDLGIGLIHVSVEVEVAEDLGLPLRRQAAVVIRVVDVAVAVVVASIRAGGERCRQDRDGAAAVRGRLSRQIVGSRR